MIDPILKAVKGGEPKPLAPPIKNMDYARTVSRKGLKGSGLGVGAEVLVLGLKVLPVSRSDPYLQRIYAVCARIVDGVHQIPSGREDDDTMAYVIDPRRLEKMSDEDQELYRGMLEKQYDKNSSH